MVDGEERQYAPPCHLSVVNWMADITTRQKQNTGPVLLQRANGVFIKGNQVYVYGGFQDAIRTTQ